MNNGRWSVVRAVKSRADHEHLGEFPFRVIVLAALALVLSVHFLLFHETNSPGTPPDALLSPESCMYIGVAVALCLFAALIHHERRTR